MDKLYCPGCKKDIQGKRNQLVYCRCGKVLLLVEIKKTIEAVDVTPKEDKDDKR